MATVKLAIATWLFVFLVIGNSKAETLGSHVVLGTQKVNTVKGMMMTGFTGRGGAETRGVLVQNRNVSGKVTAYADAEPLSGVSIVVKGGTIGTTTNADGSYTLAVPDGSILIFSFIGYETQEVPVRGRDIIDIAMQSNIRELEEMVVVGYGVQKKESVVGAIGTVQAEDLESQGNVSNLRDALVGAIPGMSVLPSSGLAGGGDSRIYKETEILIRGKTTWNDAAPLILVDGVERDINDIDINSVASISVLKDASATAVFGVKGGNGVILITTNRGQTGKPTFEIEAEMSLETPSRIVTPVGTADAIVARNHAIARTRRIQGSAVLNGFVSDEVVGYYRNGQYPYAYPDNDWIDIMFKDYSNSYRVNTTVSGGTEKVKYFALAGYNHVGDLLNGKDVGQGYKPSYRYDRINIRSNFDFKITATTDLRANFSGIHSKQTAPPGVALNAIFDATSHLPGNAMVMVYEDGVYGAYNGDISAFNPMYNLLFSGLGTTLNTSVNMDFTLTQNMDFLTKGLSISGLLAYDNRFVNSGVSVSDNGLITKTIDPEFYLRGGYYDDAQEAYILNGELIDDMEAAGWAIYDDGAGSTTGAGFGWVKEPSHYNPESLSLGGSLRTIYNEAKLNYTRTFGRHAVTGLAMFSRRHSEAGSNWANKREDWAGRITYNYNDRYFLETNGAYNGSEKFGPKYRFDFFPSFAGGWTISNEKFMDNATWLSLLKLRYSWGLVGNDRVNTGSTWPYLTIYTEQGAPSTIESSSYGYPISNYFYPRYYEGIPGNPDLRWEKARKQNLGLEVGLLRNTIMLTADAFNEYRNDMLLAANARGVPIIAGKPATAANVGEAKSKGMELSASYRNSHNGNLNYWLKANWSVARSEVIYKETPELVPAHKAPEGFPIGQTITGVHTGFINSWDDLYSSTSPNTIDQTSNLMPGDLVMLDYNGDGVYTPNDDQVPYGYPVYPQNHYGLSFGADYKGFQFSVQFVGAYNVTRRIATDIFFFNNTYIPEYILADTWTYNHTDPTFPALALGEKYMPLGHYQFFDGSYFRCNSAQIAYNLPKSFIQRLGIDNLKVYVNGRNLFLWTKMPDDGVGVNYDGKNYPTRMQLNFGLNIQL
ncbi:SusC/RagA family TonB-linked outer membrane protein [Parapedobacter sp. 10938]|uniref:SusC/RagA family TonB-linked outer membrane protein n=1 Tax=Parapedobacter flavus TaxID=3110225 RepID=UPI002DB6BF94|nr:TonB-dependent receptor [Parapedobacter sp. 10938]MEC3881069.1 TonB-dependent receptor [Parapedobacter sp. 10938]